MPRHRASLALCLLIGIGIGCGTPELEQARLALAACEDARSTATNQLTACREQTSQELDQIAKHLEGVLIESGGQVSEAPVSDAPALPPVEFQPATLDEVHQLSLAVSEQFAQLQQSQKELTRQLEASRQAARSAHEATQAELAKLQEAAADIGDQFTDVQTLREEIAALIRARDADRLYTRQVAQELADAVRAFDAERINCKQCGRGFSDRFARELLTVHGELLRGLDELRTPAEP